MTSSPKRVPYPGIEHFGERLRGSSFGHKMTRELYAYPNRSPHPRLKRDQVDERLWEDMDWAYRDEEHAQLSDAYLLVQRDNALVNFDLSVQYFASLDVDEFEAALQHVITKCRTFKPVHSLREWEGVEGAYVMVFDEYRQFYIGKSNDIRKRIKAHWTCRKDFDHVIFGSKYESIVPVDELRALDTTRIYAARSAKSFAVEARAEKAADRRFCLNRMMGGEPSRLMLMLSLSYPRTRSYATGSVVLSMDEYLRARDSVINTIAEARSSCEPLGNRLTSMDMTIYSVTLEDGTPFMWSRRDTIAHAAACGDLKVDEFAEFLVAMGEPIIWPED